MATRQITLFKFKAGVSLSQQEAIVELLRRLDVDTGANKIGVVHQVEWAIDRKKVDFVQDTTFPDEMVRDHWRLHPSHAGVVVLLVANADWTSALINIKDPL